MATKCIVEIVDKWIDLRKNNCAQLVYKQNSKQTPVNKGV